MKTIFTILICFISILSISAQEIHYTYDAAGNRIQRKTITLKSASAGIALDSVMVEEEIEEFKVMIYPNPTRGVLKVIIQGTEVDFEASALSVYNMQGTLVFKQEPAKQSNEINLMTEAPGIYFLKILLDKKVHSWRVIKQK